MAKNNDGTPTHLCTKLRPEMRESFEVSVWYSAEDRAWILGLESVHQVGLSCVEILLCPWCGEKLNAPPTEESQRNESLLDRDRTS